MSAPLAPAAVFVGRFQPPHAAHVATVLHALKRASRVLVLLGSANLARSIRNPFSAPERAAMFGAALREAGVRRGRVLFRPLPDRFDADLWAADVRAAAAEVFGPEVPVLLVGFEKDASTSYLRWFPGWERLPAPEVPGLNATDLRAAWLTRRPLPESVPQAVRAFLTRFARTPAFVRLQAEWAAVETARAALPPGAHLQEERWLHVQAEQVWLHTRRGPIGHGLWELPGRVLPPGERPAVPADAVFDHPARALVAPTAAHVWLGPPPGVFPSRPVPLARALALPRRFHEDHHVILTRLLGRV
ncbi:ADP-ribose pyrophosphatase [Deinococcus metallilatus]|uniref:ADP-ribose pyrophosphatase n=1 Tax=Deinococcus metallilatus TaxID=1211322 RepID=A0AAJ5JXW3_9DEIO|nr:adenylyltransferase/cytidyltransferase family protein [Deinococcus metallilatus]MBB5296591.1 bifunctional NMN adenylyltransferase/nudix hydrolase [Deinococcus metallilatus]QBY08388.1 ADP-ribose pyrophosphatase [Deinococcus metallilatus]RXJ11187.1 ADP-ribose pyrophosphatase [Deinococcus metallilatus]TLK24678.1 ADP-ribose pyrophosphatase [Deinococcus metallilatus]GMA17508.1 bifunctional nicotinamide mononucleotide adenylyltransferase/ADP-ribose pyrophosphatase [Deinococcus metallilatus]